MPRKTNYRFEKQEREKAKADKKAARLKAREDRTEERRTQDSDDPEQSSVTEDAPRHTPES